MTLLRLSHSRFAGSAKVPVGTSHMALQGIPQDQPTKQMEFQQYAKAAAISKCLLQCNFLPRTEIG